MRIALNLVSKSWIPQIQQQVVFIGNEKEFFSFGDFPSKTSMVDVPSQKPPFLVDFPATFDGETPGRCRSFGATASAIEVATAWGLFRQERICYMEHKPVLCLRTC